MGWGVSYVLDGDRIYCADGCKWSAKLTGVPPSGRQCVLDYYENVAHKELDMVRDECPGTAAGLRAASQEHLSKAYRAWGWASDEDSRKWHAATVQELTAEIEEYEDLLRETDTLTAEERTDFEKALRKSKRELKLENSFFAEEPAAQQAGGAGDEHGGDDEESGSDEEEQEQEEEEEEEKDDSSSEEEESG